MSFRGGNFEIVCEILHILVKFARLNSNYFEYIVRLFTAAHIDVDGPRGQVQYWILLIIYCIIVQYIFAQNNMTLLHFFVEERAPDIVRMLLLSGASVDVVDTVSDFNWELCPYF